MNQTAKTLLSLVAFGLSFSVYALTPDNRYNTIVDRNIFRLNPPPPPPSATNDPALLDRKVEFSGISNVGGTRKAWFTVPPKAGSKDLPLYLSLSEGEKADFLEVVGISEEEGEVKILNSGNSMVLSLKNNAPKAIPGAGAVAPPAPVANVVTPQPQPVATTSYANSGTPQPYGERTATVTGGTPTVPTTAQTEGGLRQIPTRTLRLAPVPTEKAVDPLAQPALMVIDKELRESQGKPSPPLPFHVPQ